LIPIFSDVQKVFSVPVGVSVEQKSDQGAPFGAVRLVERRVEGVSFVIFDDIVPEKLFSG
jgi:hypothetical protein